MLVIRHTVWPIFPICLLCHGNCVFIDRQIPLHCESKCIMWSETARKPKSTSLIVSSSIMQNLSSSEIGQLYWVDVRLSFMTFYSFSNMFMVIKNWFTNNLNCISRWHIIWSTWFIKERHSFQFSGTRGMLDTMKGFCQGQQLVVVSLLYNEVISERSEKQ